MEFKKIRSNTFIFLLIGISVLFLWVVRFYLYPIFWAIVIAVLFHPLYLYFLGKFKNKKSLALSLTLFLIILIFLIPLIAVGALVTSQAISIYNQFGNQETLVAMSNNIQDFLETPIIENIFGKIDMKEKLISWSSDISTFIYEMLASSGQVTARFLVQFFIMLYTLYFFLKDGENILKKVMHLLPLGDRYEKQLYNRFVSTSRATLKGTLLIGLIQGVMGGIALFVTSVPGSAFLGMIMVLICVIPSLGAAIILLPISIVLFVMGNFWQAIVVFVVMLAASFIDNLLRPPLVGKDTQMHPLFIFFGTLGGLLSFGITGVVIGPVIAAFLLSMWEIYEEKYKQDLLKID